MHRLMRILYVYQFYSNPDCATMGRHYAFLQRLAQRHEVTVLTTRTYYDARITHDFPWAPEGVDVRMIDAPYENEMGIRPRLLAYAQFALRAVLAGLRLPRPDLVFGSSTPLSAAWAARQIARLKGAPWVFEVRDLWPDFPVQMGAVPFAWMRRLLYCVERDLYHSAAHVVTLSTDMEAHVLRHGVPEVNVTTLVHGSDFELIDRCLPEHLETLRARHGLEGRRVALYGGTFGRANDIPTLIEAARLLRSRPDIMFVFAGYGYHTALLEQASRTLPNVLLLPAQARHQMLCWFKLADLSLVSFIDRPVLAANAPAKLFDSLACGTPVVVTNPGWTRDFVEAHQCGWYAPPSDPAALAGCIARACDDPEEIREAGRRAGEAARPAFDRSLLVDKLERIFVEAAGKG